MGICFRLREERERLGMTQEVFAPIGGVLKRALIRYEKGERVPDAAFLAAIADAGADVLYILTGKRGNMVTVPAPALDVALLEQVVAGMDEIIASSGKRLSAAQKAKHIATLYAAFLAGNNEGQQAAERLFKNVA